MVLQLEQAVAAGEGGLCVAAGGDSMPSPAAPAHDASYGAEAPPPPNHLLRPSSRTHARRPAFHVSAPGGFCSDPAGPVFWRGWYHMFFQHQPKTCQWHWGLGWAHCASRDLVRWVRLPPALAPGPEPDALDADGAFSGSAAVDPATGLPTLLYTGVFLRANAAAAQKHGVDPPHGASPLTRFCESQLAAVPAALLEAAEAAAGDGGGEGADGAAGRLAADAAHAADPLLVRWRKLPEPVMRWPPSPEEAGLRPGRKLACWRDPWIVAAASPAAAAAASTSPPPSSLAASPPPPLPPPPTLLLCSGTVDVATGDPKGGAVLAFAAPGGLTRPWRCLGLAAEQADAPPLQMPPPLREGRTEEEDDDAKEEGPLGCALPGRDWEMPRVAWVPLRERSARHGAAAVDVDARASEGAKGRGGGGGGSGRGLHALVVSPDSCDQSPLYALGRWDDGGSDMPRFDLGRAAGPWPLDLGRTFYAATVWEQPAGGEGGDGDRVDGDGGKGRTLLWGWLQEHRPEVPPPPALSGEYDHAGCLSLPRVLTLVPLLEEEEEGGEGGAGGRSGAPPAAAPLSLSASSSPPFPSLDDPRRYRIFQEPLPELAKLRSPTARWAASPGLLLAPGAAPLRVGVAAERDNGGGGDGSRGGRGEAAVIQGTHLDIEAEFEPAVPIASSDDGSDDCSAAVAVAPPHQQPAAVVALALRSWRPDGAGAGVLSYDWRSRELAFAFDDPQPTAYDERPFAPAADVAAARRRVGGRLSRPPRPGEPLKLRVLVDGSAVEVFTGGGEVLSTRVYRGEPPVAAAAAAVHPPPPPSHGASSSNKAPCSCACGVEVFASGAPVRVRRLEAWEMLRGCLDPLLLQPAAARRVAAAAAAGEGAGGGGAEEETAAAADLLSSSSMASLLLAAGAPAAGRNDDEEEDSGPTAAEIGRAAIAAIDAAEREAEGLLLVAAKAAAALVVESAAPAAIEDVPLSPPPTRRPSMLAIPAIPAAGATPEQQQQHQQQRQRRQEAQQGVAPPSPARAPLTPELSPAFLHALDLRDAAREEDARQAAAALVDCGGGGAAVVLQEEQQQ